MSEPVRAEAIFGSASRGDLDTFSDRDILIVDSDVEALKRRGKHLEVAGWSVASYTFHKLNTLSRQGALFVQHLKQEAKITVDAGGQLQAILDAFRPNKSYLTELIINRRLADLMAVRLCSERGTLWAADVLYVAVRNYGILTLAQQGRYVFSFADILQGLTETGVISAAAIPALCELRAAKSQYRKGHRVTIEVAAEMLESAVYGLPDYFPRSLVALGADAVLLNTVELPNGLPAYHRLRNLERGYLALLDRYPTAVHTNSLIELKAWIENPRNYAWVAAKGERKLIEQMQKHGLRQAEGLARNLEQGGVGNAVASHP